VIDGGRRTSWARAPGAWEVDPVSRATDATGPSAFFRAEGELLVPVPRATSGWGGPDGAGQLRGTAGAHAVDPADVR
jgi:hypothetical protein